MKRISGPVRVALATLTLAVVLVVTSVHRIHGGDWTGPFLVGGKLSSAEQWPIPVRIHEDSLGYDGQFFLALALDPFLRTSIVDVLDDAKYRAHRIAWSLGAWALGAGSDGRRVFALYLLLVLAVAGMAHEIAAWAERQGRSPWWGLVGALGLGSMVCLQRMLGDVVMAALVAGTVVRVSGDGPARRLGAGSLFALALLQKEIAILAAPVLLLGGRRGGPWRGAVMVAASVGALGIWWGYVSSVVAGATPFSLAITFDLPGKGLVEGLAVVLERTDDPLRWTKDLLFMGIHGVAIFIGLQVGWRAVRDTLRGERPDGLGAAIGLFALMGVFLSARIWVEPWSYARVLLPLVVLELLLALRPGDEACGPGRSLLLRANSLASLVGGSMLVAWNLIARVP